MVVRLVPTKKGRDMLKRLKAEMEARKATQPKKEQKKQVAHTVKEQTVEKAHTPVKEQKVVRPSDKMAKSTKEQLEKELNKAYKRNMPDKLPEDYQHPKGSTMVIYDEHANEIFRTIGSIPKKRLNRLASRHPQAQVLVDVGRGIFKMIPIKTFKKLTKIKFVLFQREYEFFGIDDDERFSKSGDWFTPNAVIDYVYSINQLLRLFIIEEAFDRANAVYLSARFYDLTGSEKVCKILYNSGRVEEVEFGDFLKRYDLSSNGKLFQTPKAKVKVKSKEEPKAKKKKKNKKSKKSNY